MSRPSGLVYSDDIKILEWAEKIQLINSIMPLLSRTLVANNISLAERLSVFSSVWVSLTSHGLLHLSENATLSKDCTSNITQWEWYVARFVYWIVVPSLQYAVAIFLADTWQYFTHRLLHKNKFLYSKFYRRYI